MQRANVIITLILAGAAALAWFWFTLAPTFPQSLGRLAYVYPDIQVPFAVTLSVAACFGWLLVWLGAWRRDRETRCRRCGHILRGLTEPRCPECGERI